MNEEGKKGSLKQLRKKSMAKAEGEVAVIVGEEEEVKLIGGWPSLFTMRARIALNLKRVEYEFLEEVFPNKSELLLKSNPVHKKIPVLIHNRRPICESLIIVQYVDEVWPDGAGGEGGGRSGILPDDPYERALQRFWASYVDDKLIPSANAATKAETEAAKAEAAEQVVAALRLLEEALQKLSRGKAFFGGDTIGFVDIALGSYLGWLRVTEKMSALKLLDEEKMPVLAGWAERFCAHEAVKEAMPADDKLMEFAEMLAAFLKGLQNKGP